MPNWELIPAPAPVRPALTAEQAAVVEAAQRIVVTVGGPGTGKTLTLVEAVVAQVNQGVALERLPVLASSRARAQELRRQITHRLGRAQISPRVTTVHGFALGLLRDEPDLDFRLLRAPEQELRLRELLNGLPGEFWPEEYRRAAETRIFARQLREFLARARQRALDPDQIAECDPERELLASVAGFAEEYLTIADFEATLDYAELIHRARLLMAQPSAAASVTARFDAVFADDVQEQDPAQAAFLGDLAMAGLPVRAFADPQQRTSAFRGASADALSALEALPGAHRMELTQGFRMSSVVVEGADALRSRLSALGAPPSPAPAPGAGGQVQVQVMDDPHRELEHVAAQVRAAHHRDGVPWHDMAIIVRTGRAQLVPVTRAMTAFGIPVEVSGDELPVAEQHAVQALLTVLRIVARSTALTSGEAVDLLAGPLGGLDATARRRLARQLMAQHPEGGTSAELLTAALDTPELMDGIELAEARRVAKLAQVLAGARRLIADGARIGEVLWQLWDGTAWPGQLQAAAVGGSRTAHHELDAVLQLFDLAERHNNLVGAAGVSTFIGEVMGESITADTAREVDLAGRGVRIVTAHRASDGQWRRVWIIGLQEGTWPRGRPAEALIDPHWLEGTTADVRTHLADERRLFYVACTRAEERLSLTASQSADPEAPLPSRFIHELGVTPERVSGAPTVRLTAAELVADLRRHAEDDQAPPELRRAAALRLARLADRPGFSTANSAVWWGSNRPEAHVAAQDVIRMSGSSLEALLRCPRQWFLARKARGDTTSQVGASVGEVMHAIVSRADDLDLSAQDMKDHLDQVWAELEFPAAWLAGSERRQMDKALERFARWRRTNNNRLLAVEYPFEVNLEVAGRVVCLNGTVDRIEEADGALRVVDFKTGRSAPAKKDVQTNPQLGIYQLAARLGAFDALLPGVRKLAPASLLMLRHGNVEPLELAQPSLDEVPGESQEATWVHELLGEAVQIISSGSYPARPGRYCDWCPIRRSCPAQEQEEADL